MAKGIRGPLVGALACALALALLAAVVFGVDAVQRLDSDALARVMTRTGDEAGPVVNSVARLADPVFLLLALALACGFALARRRPLDALAAALVLIGANVTTQALKSLLAERRIQPHLLHGELLPTDIFPSGHATAAASMAIALVLVAPASRRRLAVGVAVCFALAVDACVLVLAWHFPSDVLAGTLVASAWGFGALALRRWLEAGRSGRPLSRSEQPSRRSSPEPLDSQASPG